MVSSKSLSDFTTSDTNVSQNPAFGPTQIRELTEIFIEKSMEVSGISL